MPPDSPSPDSSESSDSVVPLDPSDASSPESSASASRLERLRRVAFEAVLVAGGVVLFLVMLYEMHMPPPENGFLSPALVGLAGVVLLWPLRGHKAVRALLLSGGLLLLLWTLDKVSRVLVPFAAVYLLAYLLNPLVERLRERYQVPRWLPSLVVTSLVVGVFVLFILILAPNIANQAQALSDRVLGTVQTLRAWLEASTVLDALEGAGLLQKQEVIAQLQALIKEQAGRLPSAAENLVASLGSFLGVVTLLALVPVILFYTLKDYPTVQSGLVDLFPTAGGRRDYLVEAGSIVGRYFRGQLLISIIATINVSVLLFLFDIPFWLLIGLLAGLLNLIPQIGALITMVVGALVALILGSWVKAVIVIAVLLGESLLEQSVLTPNILSYQVGLHPLLVLFSLLVFGTLLGVFGLLIAVPMTAILMTGYRAFREELTLDLSEYGAP
ncbi:AI-2E family transporter [Salinibacter ruber]|uniref:AI-2E family transporter n=1 Tax=Salinibacter ruber TaxID=146919 RepID=UPI00216A397F|nr:AI-2E family transporter [Salinibacter ruber]MCS4149251.1 putative PurR-regulated permease PerM [Salinibacter ruber]